jgi:hypothetical protein
LLPHWLAGLLVLTVLTPFRLPAQTNTAQAAPSSQRWLLIVETSRSMQRRADAVLQAVEDLLTSRMAGQLRRGDTLGVWTFNDDLYAGRFPLQTWSPEAQKDIASRTLTFLKGQKYEKQANFDKVLPALDRVVNNSRFLTVVLISSGDEKMRGTPFDARINEFYQKWHGEQQKARMPFVTVLRAKAGQLADYTLNTPPFQTEMPRPSQETQTAQTIQEKLLEALRNPPPPTAPPLIISGKKAPPEPTPAPGPEPAGTQAAAPAPAAAAPGTNHLLAAKPLAPAVTPIAMATTEAAPVTPAMPSTAEVPKPSPTPVTNPVEPAPAKPAAVPALPNPAAKLKPAAIEPPKPAPVPEARPALPTAPVLAPSATQEVSVPASPSRPSSLTPPPSSTPTPPVQTATAVPAETLARHRNIWIAGLILAGVAAGFALLLFRRSRSAPQASLITRSFERKNRP